MSTAIEQAFERLAARAPELARRGPEQRAQRIQALMDAVMGAREAIYAAAAKELACSQHDVNGQLLIVKADVDFAIKNIADWMAPERVPNSMMMIGKKAWIQYEPKGVILNLSTWNAPIAIGLVPAIAAIAAGNAVMLKPSELAPYSSAVLAELIAKAMPADEFAVVEGGVDVSQAVLALPFNHIYYTGGQNVGRIVMRAAAEHFAGVTLEMGGKNPVVVDASTDITDTARKILWGRISNAGQVCVAPDWVLVDRRIHDAFVAELCAQLPKMYNAAGTGFENSPDLPRIVNEGHTKRLQAMLQDAQEKGAQVAAGGRVDVATRFVEPTVLTNVTPDMAVLRDEIFGPILPVAAYDTLDDALGRIRKIHKPLALYIYARDRAVIDRVLAETSSGSTVINHNMIQSGTNPYLPFGGVNHSGTGRVGGKRGFLEFSNPRSVVEETKLADGLTPLPPFTDKDRKTMTDMLGRSTLLPPGMLPVIETVLRLRAMFRKSAV